MSMELDEGIKQIDVSLPELDEKPTTPAESEKSDATNKVWQSQTTQEKD